MLIFITFSIVAFTGILIVSFLVLKDNRERNIAVPITPEQLAKDKEKITVDNSNNTDSLLFSLKDKINNNTDYNNHSESHGSASLTTNLNNEKDQNPEKDEHFEEHEKLSKMLTEKNNAIEKYKNELENEKNNRIEFNKVKNLLEEELQNLRNNTKALQQELKEHNTVNENNKDRIKELEQEISDLKNENKKEYVPLNNSAESDIKSPENPLDNNMIGKS